MARVFGFVESSNDMQKYARNTEKAVEAKQRIGDEMRDRAKQNFQAATTTRTGQGASGIISEHAREKSEIGWADRPGFHGYFHELGFHALDNRGGKRWVLKRSSKRTGRRRTYKRVKATYVAPSPHMRPAFDSLEQKYYTEVPRQLLD